MGGLFSAPAPPPPPPLLPIPDTSDADARGRRMESLERRRRGRAGTIATSPRGFLKQSDVYPKRKSLLGE
ncbi:MAG: hypothetical protein HQ504_02020 [Rhodospirillaceae bacterium]|nr:hypothetical protein [Rhodospirillaceae bacterium]